MRLVIPLSCRSLFIEYRALFMESRDLLAKDRALMVEKGFFSSYRHSTLVQACASAALQYVQFIRFLFDGYCSTVQGLLDWLR